VHTNIHTKKHHSQRLRFILGFLFAAGTWRLLVTTGKETDMTCQDTVLLYAYGTKGHVGPILMGKGEDGVFRAGMTDELKVMMNEQGC
jgi:hypothetical protein